ncbi:unnamed protein product, partial [marine sediment metagenome]
MSAKKDTVISGIVIPERIKDFNFVLIGKEKKPF